MSVQFEQAANDETLKLIKEAFGEPIAQDRKSFLFNSLPPIDSRTMRKIAIAAKQPATVEMHDEGDIRTVGDVRYLVTPQGWRKL
jgi:hypothetical protein